jgi:hypothetical protein
MEEWEELVAGDLDPYTIGISNFEGRERKRPFLFLLAFLNGEW